MTAIPEDGPDVQTLAHYVLGHAEGPRGAYIRPGSFYESLVKTLFCADRHNRARLALAFPTLAGMVGAYKNTRDGVSRLRVAADTGEWTDA